VEVNSEEVLAQLGPTKTEARRAYVGFVKDGLSLGHLEKFYQTIDQRFLGDEEFIERIERKTDRKEEAVGVKKVSFRRLLEAVAAQQGFLSRAAYGCSAKQTLNENTGAIGLSR
jgi:hypothetical protein